MTSYCLKISIFKHTHESKCTLLIVFSMARLKGTVVLYVVKCEFQIQCPLFRDFTVTSVHASCSMKFSLKEQWAVYEAV